MSVLLFSIGCVDAHRVEIGTARLDDVCSTTANCEAGLVCRDGHCDPVKPNPTPPPSSCGDDVPCRDGRCCGADGFCRPVRSEYEASRCGFSAGHRCLFDAECDVEFDCSATGVCVAETLAGPGEKCIDALDCRAPLTCGPNSTCDRLPFSLPTSCLTTIEDFGPFSGLFDHDPYEFYRLPFPNDLRIADGGLDLSEHVSPGEIFGRDAIDLLFGSLAHDFDGFALAGPIFVRMSDKVFVPSITTATDDPDAALQLVDIDPDSPFIGERIPIERTYTTGKQRFICDHAITVAPVPGIPLRPRTTYALIVTNTLTSSVGRFPGQANDALRAALGPDGPANYAPLREHLERERTGPIANATVFTTGDPAAIANRVRTAIREAPDEFAPRVEEVVRCRDAAPQAPCSCPDASSAEHFAGRLQLPILQNGTPPYETVGGAIVGEDGTINAHRVDEVCFTLTVPEGLVPAAGWPLVIYAHGTGGSHLSGTNNVALDLHTGRTSIATLTFDGVMHGLRRGDSDRTPDVLFFNLLNPIAARDNALQGAGDLFAITRMLERDQSVGDVRIDTGRLMFYGHSQGGIVGVPFLRYEPLIRAAVLTGTGADIGLALVGKQSPVDIAAALRGVLGAESRHHPLVGLMYHLLAPVDAISYAAELTRRDGTPLDLLIVYGLRDTYTPESSQQTLARAVGAKLVEAPGATSAYIAGVDVVSTPYTGPGDGPVVGVIQFAPTDYDGHFVGTKNPHARFSIRRFLNTASRGQAEIVR